MIFFDIDGTLLHHELAEKLGSIEFYNLNHQKLKMNETDFVNLWFELSHKYFGKYLAKEISFQEHRRKRIMELFGYHLSDEAANQLFNRYLTLYKKNWTTFEDVISCLEQLKSIGCRLGIISNGDYIQQLQKLEKLNIHKYFEYVITSSEVGIAKPNKMIFLEACKKAKVLIQDSYYVGDQIVTDAIGSKNAGMKGIWLNRKLDNTTYPDVIEIHNLHELVPLLSKNKVK